MQHIRISRFPAFFLLTLLLAAFGFSACNPDSVSACEKRTEQQGEDIEKYLTDKGLKDNAQKTAEGIYYIIETNGTGDRPSISSKITVNYKGYFLDDKSFDQGTDISFFLSEVIQGWQIGMQLFKEGGKGKLFIPSCYGYGSNPPSGIPKNSVLVFDIELLQVR